MPSGPKALAITASVPKGAAAHMNILHQWERPAKNESTVDRTTGRLVNCMNGWLDGEMDGESDGQLQAQKGWSNECMSLMPKESKTSRETGKKKMTTWALEGQYNAQGCRSQGKCMQLPLTKSMSHAMHTELDQHLAEAQAELSCTHDNTIWYFTAVVFYQSM